MKATSETPQMIYQIEITDPSEGTWYEKMQGVKMLVRLDSLASIYDGQVVSEYSFFLLCAESENPELYKWQEHKGAINLTDARITGQFLIDRYYRQESILPLSQAAQWEQSINH